VPTLTHLRLCRRAAR